MWEQSLQDVFVEIFRQKSLEVGDRLRDGFLEGKGTSPSCPDQPCAHTPARRGTSPERAPPTSGQLVVCRFVPRNVMSSAQHTS